MIFIMANILILNAQSNRVLNPHLEEHDTCFPAIGGFGHNQVKHWSEPAVGSSDYYLKYAFDISTASDCNYRNACTPPQTLFGFEFPHSGGSFGGLGIYEDDDSTFREYIQASLRTRLDSNKMYAIECFISVSDYTNCTPDFGFYFSDTTISHYLNGRIDEIPQFENPISNPINTQHGWQRITGSYLSDGNDTFVIIGNFTPYYLHHSSPCASKLSLVPSTYIFIDDVAVYDTSLIDTVMLCSHDSVQFNNQWYSTDGLYTDMIGGLPVKRLIQHRPVSASYTFVDVPFTVGDTVQIGFMYVCHSDSFIYPTIVCDSMFSIGCVREIYLWPIVRDTVIDQVFENIYGCDSTVRYRVRTHDTLSNIGIAAIDKGMYPLAIYPNPANNLINVKMRVNSVEATQYEVEIYDYVGRKIELPGQSSPTNAAKSLEVHFQLQISDINDGMYFVRIVDSHHKVVGSGKFVKE